MAAVAGCFVKGVAAFTHISPLAPGEFSTCACLCCTVVVAAVSPSIEGDDDVSAMVNRKGVSRAGVADGFIFTHPDTEVT